jgi:hypothetical protein
LPPEADVAEISLGKAAESLSVQDQNEAKDGDVRRRIT